MRFLAALIVFAPAFAGAATLELSGVHRQMFSALKNSGSPASIYLLSDRVDRFDRENHETYTELETFSELIDTSLKVFGAEQINENLLNFVGAMKFRNARLEALKADADAAVAEASGGSSIGNAAQSLKMNALALRTHLEGMRAGASAIALSVEKHQAQLGMPATLAAAEIIRQCDAAVVTGQGILKDADLLLAKSQGR